MADDRQPDSKDARTPLFRALKAIVSKGEIAKKQIESVNAERGLIPGSRTAELNRPIVTVPNESETEVP